MDIRLNLLPPEIMAREQKKSRLLLWAGGLTLVLLVQVALMFVLGSVTTQARLEAAHYQAQHQVLQEEMQSLQNYAVGQEQLQRLRSIAHEAMGTPPDWAGLLAAVGLNIPPDVWLDKLTASYQVVPSPEEDARALTVAVGEIVISGWAPSHLAVAGWLGEMQHMPGITAIRCQYSMENQLQGHTLVQFEIKAALLPGPERLLWPEAVVGDDQ